jgi:hypothetical protein
VVEVVAVVLAAVAPSALGASPDAPVASAHAYLVGDRYPPGPLK